MQCFYFAILQRILNVMSGKSSNYDMILKKENSMKNKKTGFSGKLNLNKKSYQLEILKILAVFFGIGRRLHSTKINNQYLAFKGELNIKKIRPVLL